jgi:hypothetical protein
LAVKPTSGDCAKPPDTISGLLTAPCGDGFDVALDDRLGYLDWANDFAGSQAAWAPAVASGQRRRWFWFGRRSTERIATKLEKRHIFSWLTDASLAAAFNAGPKRVLTVVTLIRCSGLRVR